MQIAIGKKAHQLTLMTFNIENGGDQIDLQSVIIAIQKGQADVVGIQESWGNLEKIADGLNWSYVSRKQHIISRLPLYEIDKDYLFIEVTPKKFAALANIHLPDEHYGPENLLAGAEISKVVGEEKRWRLNFIESVTLKLSQLARTMPVFLTGDFNSPSHLDKKYHEIDWPVTKMLEAKRFIDAYQITHGKQSFSSRTTWPARRSLVMHSYDTFNPSINDPKDRIDFIFAHGPVEVLNSKIIGESLLESDLVISPWPSDHRAVVASFAIKPQAKEIAENFLSKKKNLDFENPKISVDTPLIKTGQAFKIRFQTAPGYRYDYLRIKPIHSDKIGWGEAVRLYTFAQNEGVIEYNQENAQGNWLSWHKASESKWPLSPGRYEITLMLDDGFKALASTEIEIIA